MLYSIFIYTLSRAHNNDCAFRVWGGGGGEEGEGERVTSISMCGASKKFEMY